ncbi:GNAT domain-domain-containing protein [Microdochium bolleyi]|uniref:GNAT domain-domain-containing protein n=1 Tax=Microdochium bolleyi TaxID=196109 RepID=A0A136JJE7_9PEZI|nr:GNAT domain-domain-containing protein [Microdochium bolleyi]
MAPHTADEPVAATTITSQDSDPATEPAIASRKVTVRTTLPVTPLPALAGRQPLETERLRLVPISQDDLAGYHAIRTRPEYMVHSSQGRVDRDLGETQAWLNRFLPPNDGSTYVFAIKEKVVGAGPVGAETGTATGEGAEKEDDMDRAIGMMGIVRMNSGTGWPEVGYGINTTHHGKGYATELLREVVRFWWTLPREEVVVEMKPRYVFGTAPFTEGVGVLREEDPELVEMPERIMAVADITNARSLRVMEKLGFVRFAEWDREDDPSERDAACWLLRPTG